MTTERPSTDDTPATEQPTPPRREPSRFSDWGPDYGPELLDYEQPPYDEREPENVGRDRASGVRALVDDGSIHPDLWLLVSTDGSSGRATIDVDAAADGDLRILHALEPISGEPQLAVVPPPDWARDW